MKKSKNNNNHWWKPIEESLAGLNLKSLKVICPQCGEPGIVITRWVKGPALKPIYILHLKRRKVRKVCELSEEQSNLIRSQVSLLKSDIKTLLSSRKSFVLFSGGTDSLCTLIYLRDIAEDVGHDLTVIYVNTTVGLPENIKYVKKVCTYLGLKLEIVKPKLDYFTLVQKWGIPSFKYRWCCRELKIKPIKEFLDKIKEPKVVFDGIRAAESGIRAKYIPIWYHPTFKCLSASPIFRWSNEHVISCVNSNGIPKTLLHSIGSSAECWCGAYKTKSDFEKLYNLDRDMFYKLIKVEEENRNGYTFLYKNGQRISLKELAKTLERGNIND